MPSRWVGILGGTFDPVHLAHLQLAEGVCSRLALDHVLLMPAPSPRLRDPPVAGVEARVAMVAQAIAGHPNLRLDRREVERPGPTRTIDTLEQMRRQQPERGLCLILGADAFARLDSWHRWRDLFALCHLAVATRPGAEPEWSAALAAEIAPRRATPGAMPGDAAAGLVFACATPTGALSASEIRARVARGAAFDNLVPAAVAAYITQRGLYARTA